MLARAGVARLVRYFENTPAPDLHRKTARDGLMDKAGRDRVVKDVLALQRG